MKDNCSYCLYSKDTETSIFLKDMIGHEFSICDHENSPFYNKSVDENKVCRLFINEKHYFLMKDRKDKLNKLKNENI